MNRMVLDKCHGSCARRSGFSKKNFTKTAGNCLSAYIRAPCVVVRIGGGDRRCAHWSPSWSFRVFPLMLHRSASMRDTLERYARQRCERQMCKAANVQSGKCVKRQMCTAANVYSGKCAKRQRCKAANVQTYVRTKEQKQLRRCFRVHKCMRLKCVARMEATTNGFAHLTFVLHYFGIRSRLKRKARVHLWLTFEGNQKEAKKHAKKMKKNTRKNAKNAKKVKNAKKRETREKRERMSKISTKLNGMFCTGVLSCFSRSHA